MLMPKKVKHRKHQKGTWKGKSFRGSSLDFGSFGLIALDRGWMSARQIEASRRAMTRYVKRGGKIWIRVFPDKAVTKKPPEVGMGGGKGSPEKFVVVIKPGRVLFEMDGVSKEVAREAMRLAAHKLSFKTKFLSKEDI